MPLIDNRYAEALINLSSEKGAIETYQEELSFVGGIYASEAELRTFLLDPENRLATKKTVLNNIFAGKVQQDILNLLFLLLDKGRIESLPGISREFSRLADKQRNILNITIMTAVPIDQAGIDRISEKFRHLYQASSVKVTLDVQPSLIGGVKVAVGDKLYDGTVKGKLAGLQAILSGK